MTKLYSQYGLCEARQEARHDGLVTQLHSSRGARGGVQGDQQDGACR